MNESGNASKISGSKRLCEANFANANMISNKEKPFDESSPDNASTSASEASSGNSRNSEPAFFDLIGTACMGSMWFTTCFPCAVVDINDSDERVVEKLSRTSVMNVMYGSMNDSEVINSFEYCENDKGEDCHLTEDNPIFTALPSIPAEPKQEPIDMATNDQQEINGSTVLENYPICEMDTESLSEKSHGSEPCPLPAQSPLGEEGTANSPPRKMFSMMHIKATGLKRLFKRKKQ